LYERACFRVGGRQEERNVDGDFSFLGGRRGRKTTVQVVRQGRV
jgi:hypothetical protein